MTSTTSVPDRSLTVSGVGPAERVQVDHLDVVEIHHDVADVASEAQPPAVGGAIEALADGAAVEQHRVGAVLALDRVAAVAGIPLEPVVTGSEQRDVVGLVAVEEVVAVAAEQEVDAVAPEERVVARTPIDRDLDQGGEVPRRGEAVVAAVRVHDQVLRGADVDRERCGVDAVEPDACAVGRGGELLGAVAAVDLDCVGAVRAFVEVGVVTGVPDHPVVAALAEGLVVGVAAGQGVVLAAAEQEVSPALAEERVVAALAEELVATGPAGEGVVAGAAEQVPPWQRTV